MIEIFLDTADIEEIRLAMNEGILDGVTTNPSTIKKSFEKYKKINHNLNLEKYIIETLKICKNKPVSLEVVGDTLEEMISEGETLYKKFYRYGNVYIKIPVNPCMEKICSHDSDGIQAIKELTKKKIPINCTLIFTPEQALLAAKVGAKFVSPFIGREDDYIQTINRLKLKKGEIIPENNYKKSKKILDDNGIDSGIDLLKEIVKIFRVNKVKSKVLAASIRSKRQFREAALAGADIITIPFNIFKELLTHEKTREGMKKFTDDTVEEYKKLLKG